jgi:hypothetical protein
MRSPLPTILTAGVLGLALQLTGCGAGPARRDLDDRPVPVWIHKLPLEENYIYESGSYFGSLNPNDNEKNAVKTAMTRLAHAVESRVHSRVRVRASQGDTLAQHHADVTSEVVLRNAQHLESWTDVEGRVGQRGTVWVLVRVPVAQ